MSKKEIESLEEIKKHLASLKQFDYKLLNNVIVKLQELEVRRKEDHILLLRLSGTVEELALTSGDWKVLRRTVVWIVTILSGFLTYFFGKD
jgi:hypothetical protein